MAVTRDAAYWINRFQMQPHPEGGYYAVTYEAPTSVIHDHFPGPRRASTAIYFLIDGPDNFSAFHRIHSDELWHFYAGDDLLVHVISPEGEYAPLRLGPDHAFQAVVPAGYWFASSLANPQPGAYALVGCTVAPGFDFEDFELADREALTALYPRHAPLIERYTRPLHTPRL